MFIARLFVVFIVVASSWKQAERREMLMCLQVLIFVFLTLWQETEGKESVFGFLMGYTVFFFNFTIIAKKGDFSEMLYIICSVS